MVPLEQDNPQANKLSNISGKKGKGAGKSNNQIMYAINYQYVTSVSLIAFEFLVGWTIWTMIHSRNGGCNCITIFFQLFFFNLHLGSL